MRTIFRGLRRRRKFSLRSFASGGGRIIDGLAMFRRAAILIALLVPHQASAADDLCGAAAHEIDRSLRAFTPPKEAVRTGRISISRAAHQHAAAGLDFGAKLDVTELDSFPLNQEERAGFDNALRLIYRAGGATGLVMLDAIQGTAYCHNPLVFSNADGANKRVNTPEAEPFSLCVDGGVALGYVAGTPFYAETRDNRLDQDELKIFPLRNGVLTEACSIAAHYQLIYETEERFCKEPASCGEFAEKTASWAERLRSFGVLEASELTPAKAPASLENNDEFPLFGAKGSELVPGAFRFDGAESWFVLKGDSRADLLRIGPAREGPRMMADWSSFTLVTLYKGGEAVASFVVEKRRGVFQDLAAFAKLSPEAPPEAVVAALYRAAGGVGGDYSHPISIFADPLGRATFLSTGLREALDAMDKRTQPGDVPDLDFDPVTSSQDPNVRDLKIVAERQETGKGEDKAAVRVSFGRSGDKSKPITLRYWLVRQSDGWRIDDIANMGKDAWRIGAILQRN